MPLKISFLLLCVCILVFPINYSFALSLRLFDILYILLFIVVLFTNPKVNKLLLILVIFIFIVFFISTLNGLIIKGPFETNKIVFVYKYFLIFSLPWVVVNIIKYDHQIRRINSLLLIVYFLLCIWVYLYSYLLSNGTIIGNIRPSFPLSNDYIYTDAHMYSSYLGFFLVAYMFYLRRYFNHRKPLTLFILINGLMAVIFTGSRTGIALVFLSIFIYLIYFLIKLPKFKISFSKRKLISLITTSIVFIFSLLYFTEYINDFYQNYEKLISRSLNFQLSTDQSSLGRIKKLELSIEDINLSGVFIGLGLSSSLIWHDGLLSILLAHGGVILLISVLLFYWFIFLSLYIKIKNAKLEVVKLFRVLSLLVIIYFFANIITEYIFISRNAFPILLLISNLYVSIKYKNSLTFNKVIYSKNNHKDLYG
jgi:hypothetical protein